MRILTWNVNGLKPMVKKYGSLENLLNTLQADIICFQEVKLRKCDLDRELALVPGWESFFSLFGGNRGYSGVATFCRRSVTVPIQAAEGITGVLSGSTWETGCDWSEYTVAEMQEIDGEGRCVVTDHGEFVLFNIYGPAISSEERAEERFSYKLKFYKALEHRMLHHMSQGQRVILLGDLNISPAPIDSCDPATGFMNREDRQWLHALLLQGGGPFVDTFRVFHPTRQEAFTCWSTASGARINNYGTRIDLILAAPADQQTPPPRNISTWLAAADIWPELDGSDHAPSWVDVACPVDLPRDIPPPALSTSNMFTGKQGSVKGWLVKGGPRVEPSDLFREGSNAVSSQGSGVKRGEGPAGAKGGKGKTSKGSVGGSQIKGSFLSEPTDPVGGSQTKGAILPDRTVSARRSKVNPG